MKIAILEDNAGMIRMLQLALKSSGYEVYAFQEVKAFLDFFTTFEDIGLIDLIITDFRLETEKTKSKLSGADVIRLVRINCPEIPAILISAAPMFQLEEAVKDIPGVHILQKVFKLSFLLETIQALSR